MTREFHHPIDIMHAVIVVWCDFMLVEYQKHQNIVHDEGNKVRRRMSIHQKLYECFLFTFTKELGPFFYDLMAKGIC